MYLLRVKTRPWKFLDLARKRTSRAREHALGRPTSQLTIFGGLDYRILNFSKFKLLQEYWV